LDFSESFANSTGRYISSVFKGPPPLEKCLVTIVKAKDSYIESLIVLGVAIDKVILEETKVIKSGLARIDEKVEAIIPSVETQFAGNPCQPVQC
jgi:hypothetical protein